MSFSIHRILSFFLPGPQRPNPLVTGHLGLAAEQQAIFQMLIGPDKVKQTFQYLVCRGVHNHGVVLSSMDSYFTFMMGWKHKEFAYRFLIQTESDQLPKLHKFQAKITDVHRDRKSITVAIPSSITVLEQRRNVRLKLQGHHLPGLVIWGLLKGKTDNKPRLTKQRLILDLTQADEVQRILKNISAGGLRLSLPRHLYAPNGQWLSKGCPLLVQLAFPGLDAGMQHAYKFIAKVSNVRVMDEACTRPEIGVQFTSARVNGPPARWQDVSPDGWPELFKLLHSFQLEYYKSLKKNLIMREQSVSR